MSAATGTEAATDRCENCGSIESSPGDYQCCSGCQLVNYCSTTCQKDDWKVHKGTCKLSKLFSADSEKLLLHPDHQHDTSIPPFLDFNAALSFAEKCMTRLKHVDIRLPQEFVLDQDDSTSFSLYSTDPPENGIKLETKYLDSFLENCHELTTFRFQAAECCWHQVRRMTDHGRVWKGLARHEQLQVLSLNYAVFNDVKTLTQLLDSSYNLRVLKLNSLALSKHGSEPWSRNVVDSLVTSISFHGTLVKLSVDDCYFRDQDIANLLGEMPRLRSLTLSGAFGDNQPGSYLTDVGFNAIAALCPDLQSLDLSYHGLATTDSVETILRNCKQLRELHIPRVQIHNLDLAGLVRLSDTLLLLRFGGPSFGGPPITSIKKAIIATGGRTLFVHGYQGLVEVLDLPQSIRDEAART